MKLSDEGLRLIKSFEGYHEAREDGSCEAYQCPAGVWTIGWGCTKGVNQGMIWTAEEAEAAFRYELRGFEAGVARVTTVDLNQNQFDALVSFAYNCGIGALERSSLLKAVNRQQWDKAAAAFHDWNKGGGKVLPGLVQRRAREAALFMKPAHAPEAPSMPQAVTKSVNVGKKAVATVATAAGAVAPEAAKNLPPPPDLSGLSAYQTAAEQAGSLGTWAWSHPWLTAGLACWLILATLFPQLVSRLTPASPS